MGPGHDPGQRREAPALGFLAGFSERFAQDMFARSGQRLAGESDETPATGLSAGLAPLPAGAKP